ncbi:MAG TPA: hypothetical protein VGH90_09280, partial [Chthoniobacteraceae bacterium]
MAARRLSTTEQHFFARYLAALEAAGIPCLILRNYDEFPESIGNDLDLFVPRGDLTRAVDLFRETLRTGGGRLFLSNPRDYVFDLRFSMDGTVASVLELDLFHGAFTWHGQPYLESGKLLGDAVKCPNGFRVPRPAHEALNLVLVSLLWGGFFKERYRARIVERLSTSEEREELERCVDWAFGCKLGFDPCAPVSPSKDEVKAAAVRLRRALMKRSFERDGTKAMARWARHWLAELGTVFRPLGMHIAILGPDGSGKSAAIARARERLGKLFVDTHVHHWRPSILPDLGVLFRKRKRHEGPVKDPHGQTPHSRPVSLFRLLYYSLDYWLGYFAQIWKRKAQTHLVLFDRYAADMWCDPRRYRLALPDPLLRWVASLAPQPDFTFVLLADAEVLQRRKGELPPEQIGAILA